MQKDASSQETHFFKLHGAGNDLLVVDTRDLPKRNKAAFIRKMAHRQLGIGCDQLVEVLSYKPLAIQIWNRDGSQAEMCANGSRTFLFFAARQRWIGQKEKRVPIQVSGGAYEGLLIKPGNYELCLGEPEIGSSDRLEIKQDRIPFTPVKTGNPHAVIWTTGPGAWKVPAFFDFREYGPKIESHRRFPNRTNVEFIRSCSIKGRTAKVAVDVWERGAGPTLSCGSGAVAVAAVVRQRYRVDLIKVAMTDFELRVRFEKNRAYLSGPCALVSQGVYFS